VQEKGLLYKQQMNMMKLEMMGIKWLHSDKHANRKLSKQ